MRADYIAPMQSAIFDGLGEPVTIGAVAGRAVWIPAGDVSTGADGAVVISEVDQFAFRRRDALIVAAAVEGAVVRRSNGSRYQIDGIGELGGELHTVTVREAE